VIDEIDRSLIVATQGGLPLVPRPYHAIAEQVGLSADDVMRRLSAMLETGIIRRIGAVPNHYAIGWTANGMTVWDVADDQVDELGARIGALDFVTHCYRRPRHLPKASPGRSQDAESPSGGDGAQCTPTGGICWPYNLFAMLHGRTRAEVEHQAEQVRELLGTACRGHDILYSTAILKKTGLRLRQSQES